MEQHFFLAQTITGLYIDVGNGKVSRIDVISFYLARSHHYKSWAWPLDMVTQSNMLVFHGLGFCLIGKK